MEKKSIIWRSERHELEAHEYAVQLNGEQALVTLDEHGGVTLDNGKERVTHLFISLVNAARRDKLPAWVKQIPSLQQRLDAALDDMRAKGIDPYIDFAMDGENLIHVDLRSGTRLARPVTVLKKLLTSGQPLPRAFQSQRAVELLKAP